MSNRIGTDAFGGIAFADGSATVSSLGSEELRRKRRAMDNGLSRGIRWWNYNVNRLA
jgi:hypothetical protein